MNGALLLQHAAAVIENRERAYGPAQPLFAQVATRWSLVLGAAVTPAQVALCLIDLKLARLTNIRRTSTASSMSSATPPACAR